MKFTLSSSLLAVFAALSMFHQKTMAATPITIGALDAAVFDTTSGASSTIKVSYTLDGASLGPEANDEDFYVLQELKDGADCDAAYGETYTSLSGAAEPALVGFQGTSTLVNTADWPRGDNLFCLRLQLMLQMSDGNDLVWHQRDFKFTVTVAFSDGSTNVVFIDSGGSGVAQDLTFEAADAQDQTGSDTGVAPTFSTVVTGSTFAYGDDVPIVINFEHPLNVFAYSVDEANVIPVDGSNVQLKDPSNNDISLRTSSFVMTNPTFPGISGTLTISLPLVIYQMTTVTTVRILIPVSWTNNARRNLRALEESSSTGSSSSSTGQYTGPVSGVVDEVVEIELIPYVDEGSGAIVGFTVGGVATFCMGAGAALFL